MERFAHGGNIYREASPRGEWMDFSANINPLGLPASVRGCLQESLDEVVHYPDPEAAALKAALSAHYGLPTERLLPGNGAAELFYLFFQAMKFRRVLLPVPSFSEYERAARAAGAQVRHFPLDAARDFAPDWERLLAAMGEADCLVLGNPNNPTGNLLTASELERCLQRLQAGGAWLLVDESFLDFREDEALFSVRRLVGRYPHLIVVQSLTKFYALPGLRLGFAAAERPLLERMGALRDVWSVNLLAQKAGVAALADRAYQEASRAYVRREKDWLAAALRRLPGLRVFPPSVNFILVQLRQGGEADVMARMKAHNILVRDCANYPGLERGYWRMAVRTHEENEAIVRSWRAICEEGGASD